MSRSSDESHRLVPVDAAIRARFQAELPAVITWREQRLLPGHRRWGAEALGYSLPVLVGLYFLGWSPMLAFLHLVVTQWIGLVAEVLVLRRLAQRGVTKLLSAAQVNAFVQTVDSVLERARLAGNAAKAPHIPYSVLPDVITSNDTAKNANPNGLASLLVFFGVIATGILLVAMVYAKGSLQDELLSQPVALVFLGAFSLVQLVTQFRHRLAPPTAGASWNVEFTPGLRLFGLTLIALLSPAVLQEADEVRSIAMASYAAIALWGVVTLTTLGMLRRSTSKLREALVASGRGHDR